MRRPGRRGVPGLIAVLGGAALLAGCAAPTRPGTVTVTPSGPSSTASSSVTPSPSPTTPMTVEDRAERLVARMSRSERAGQVLLTAGTVPQLRGLARLVRSGRVAGVMVRGRSVAGVAAVRSSLRPLRSASPDGLPLLTATDQEGGAVQVLSGPGFPRIPSAVDQARMPPARLRHDAERWGGSLAAAGVNLDLAPVADVPCRSTARDNPPVADLRRNYGTDPVAAGRRVDAVVAGLRSAGVATTLKHFPGLGCVRANTDTAAYVVDAATGTDSARLGPFAAGIRSGAGFVMVSSAEYARIDRGTPALFSSRVVRGMLRERLGFDGVVMSDDAGGAAALRRWTPAQRATRFVAAGGDLLLDIVPDHVPAMHRALVHRAVSDPRFDVALRVAAGRVVAARLRLAR